MKRKILSVAVALSLIFNPTFRARADAGLTPYQKKTADKVAQVTAENWKKYGVLPSVAVAQTFIESSLGVNQVRPNNLWGIRPNGQYASYTSMEDGIYAYLRVINNGYYDKALHVRDYEKQIEEILAGGYYGEDDGGTVDEYYNHVVSSIRRYGFDEYDRQLFADLKERAEERRRKKWNKTYTLVYEPGLNENQVRVDRKIIRRGTVQIWKRKQMQGIYDVTGGQKGRRIGVGNKWLDGMKVRIAVNEDAKG